VIGGHPPDQYDSSETEPVQRTDLAYLLLGAADAAQRRARAAVGTTVHVAAAVAAPAVAAVDATPLGAPVRRRAAALTDPLVADGRSITGLARRTVDDGVRRITSEALDSTVLDAAVARVLSSGAVRRVVTVVINHPATDALMADALNGPAVDQTVTRVMQSRLVDELTDQLVTAVVNHPATDRVISDVLDGSQTDRIVARVMESRLFDELITQLLESEELRRLVAHVSTSPEVRAALSQQTAGFAGDVTVGVRSRTVTADDTVEKAARSLLRRPRRVQPD
jgi:hypothetical protein